MASRLVEPGDYAYRASIVAMTQGFLTLSGSQAEALARTLGGPGGRASVLPQWGQLPDGQWISEKDPGYPFLTAPFQALGIITMTTTGISAAGIGGTIKGCPGPQAGANPGPAGMRCPVGGRVNLPG